jgi:hypothetical protein
MFDLIAYFIEWTVKHPFQAAYVWCLLLTAGYLIYAALLPVWKKLPKWLWLWLAPFAIFYPVDIIVRAIIGGLIFWERISRDTLTVTALCNSHVNDPDGASWRNYKRTIGGGMCRIMNIIINGHCSACK